MSSVITSARKPPEAAARAAWRLRDLHSGDLPMRRRIRDICNGGTTGLNALLGDLPRNPDTVPASNLILSGITRLAQRLGQAPTVRVDPPDAGDSDRSRRKVERIERIVADYDAYPHALELQLPQMARWVPGYGYASWVIHETLDINGYRRPAASLRDPMDTFPGEWGPNQQPSEVCFVRRVPVLELLSIYPSARAKLANAKMAKTPVVPVSANRVISHGGSFGQISGNWEGNPGSFIDQEYVELLEYYDAWGCYLMLYDGSPLEAYESPLSTPQFVVVKRFAFDALQGQFDQVIGLLAAMARLNVLAEIAMRDSVFAETIITGDLDGQWNRGRNAVNKIIGGDAKKLQSNLPYQMFQEVDRIEDQLRKTSNYSVQSDGDSPLSFATGRGLDNLQASGDAEIRELQTVFRHGLQTRDAKMLEWDQRAYPNQTRTIEGELRGASFSETYTPAKDISGKYRTRRAYGAMAGFDDYQKIVAGLQLQGAGVISRTTMQENITGLENLHRENQRIRAEQAEITLMAMFQAASAGQPVDARAAMVLTSMLAPGEFRTEMERFFTPEEPQLTPEQQAMIDQATAAQQPQGPMLPEQPPDVQTALSLMRAGGEAEGGIQTVSRL